MSRLTPTKTRAVYGIMHSTMALGGCKTQLATTGIYGDVSSIRKMRQQRPLTYTCHGTTSHCNTRRHPQWDASVKIGPTTLRLKSAACRVPAEGARKCRHHVWRENGTVGLRTTSNGDTALSCASRIIANKRATCGVSTRRRTALLYSSSPDSIAIQAFWR